MTFATSAVVMSQVAAAEAAATAAAMAATAGGAATAATAATSGIEAATAASAQQAAQAAMTGAGGATAAAPTAAMAAPTATGGIQGANLANFSGNTMIDAGGSLIGESGGPLALPSTPVAPEVATPAQVATPAAVPAPAAPTGIEQIGTNQLNPYTGAPDYSAANNASQYEKMIARNNASGMPGMPSTAPYGANYEQLSSVTNQAPSAFNTSAGSFEGVQGTPPSALERGFGKVMDWAEKNPLTSLYAASTMANALLAPSDEEPKKKPSSLSKYKLSPNFQPSRPVPNVYQPQYQSFAEGGIAALAGGSYPMGRQDNTQFATPTQMPMSAEVVNADYEPIEMASGGLGRLTAGNEENKFYNPIFGKGGGQSVEPVDPLAKFVRAPNVAPNPYKPSYVPETRTPVGPPTNGPILDYAAKWGGAQNLLNTYAPNLAPPQSAPAMATAPAASGPGFKSGGMPSPGIDVGIVSEDDPDFAFTSPFKTTAGKLDKLYKKTHVSQKSMATAPELGAIDLNPAMVKRGAQGGIMGADSSLGGYAAGGNPRLLKGPGDGMSDDIPATIANKQPARLADGEFVIPADVVSHLGNGSTEAGAKQLHGMMDKVRTARTGRKAQGKQINPKKFMPK
jgi:hypothetical protein